MARKTKETKKKAGKSDGNGTLSAAQKAVETRRAKMTALLNAARAAVPHLKGELQSNLQSALEAFA